MLDVVLLEHRRGWGEGQVLPLSTLVVVVAVVFLRCFFFKIVVFLRLLSSLRRFLKSAHSSGPGFQVNIELLCLAVDIKSPTFKKIKFEPPNVVAASTAKVTKTSKKYTRRKLLDNDTDKPL